jgi:ribosomal protein S18 acetylase RimI-like enzyme
VDPFQRVERREPDLEIRNAEADDFYPITAVINDWWGGRQMRDMLPKLFFVHFRETSFIAEVDGRRVGFLCGFLSQTFPDEAYIHFLGVHPDWRKAGVARLLYQRFFDAVRAHDRRIVRCVTSPVNKTSIAFHLRMGFAVEPGDAEVDGIAVHANYDGMGEPRVLFVKTL